MNDLKVVWQDHGRTAQNPSDPLFPHGKDVDITPIGAVAACSTVLPYPAPRCGLWIVTCSQCGLRVGVTAAGRPDDPRSVKVACQLGATGDFPEGKLGDDDEGGLKIGVAADIPNGVVRVEFGKEVAWLAMPPETALDLAKSIIDHALAISAAKPKGKRQ